MGDGPGIDKPPDPGGDKAGLLGYPDPNNIRYLANQLKKLAGRHDDLAGVVVSATSGADWASRAREAAVGSAESVADVNYRAAAGALRVAHDLWDYADSIDDAIRLEKKNAIALLVMLIVDLAIAFVPIGDIMSEWVAGIVEVLGPRVSAGAVAVTLGFAYGAASGFTSAWLGELVGTAAMGTPFLAGGGVENVLLNTLLGGLVSGGLTAGQLGKVGGKGGKPGDVSVGSGSAGSSVPGGRPGGSGAGVGGKGDRVPGSGLVGVNLPKGGPEVSLSAGARGKPADSSGLGNGKVPDPGLDRGEGLGEASVRSGPDQTEEAAGLASASLVGGGGPGRGAAPRGSMPGGRAPDAEVPDGETASVKASDDPGRRYSVDSSVKTEVGSSVTTHVPPGQVKERGSSSSLGGRPAGREPSPDRGAWSSVAPDRPPGVEESVPRTGRPDPVSLDPPITSAAQRPNGSAPRDAPSAKSSTPEGSGSGPGRGSGMSAAPPARQVVSTDPAREGEAPPPLSRSDGVASGEGPSRTAGRFPDPPRGGQTVTSTAVEHSGQGPAGEAPALTGRGKAQSPKPTDVSDLHSGPAATSRTHQPPASGGEPGYGGRPMTIDDLPAHPQRPVSRAEPDGRTQHPFLRPGTQVGTGGTASAANKELAEAHAVSVAKAESDPPGQRLLPPAKRQPVRDGPGYNGKTYTIDDIPEKLDGELTTGDFVWVGKPTKFPAGVDHILLKDPPPPPKASQFLGTGRLAGGQLEERGTPPETHHSGNGSVPAEASGEPGHGAGARSAAGPDEATTSGTHPGGKAGGMSASAHPSPRETRPGETRAVVFKTKTGAWWVRLPDDAVRGPEGTTAKGAGSGKDKPEAGGFRDAGRLLQDGRQVKPNPEPTGGVSGAGGAGGKPPDRWMRLPKPYGGEAPKGRPKDAADRPPEPEQEYYWEEYSESGALHGFGPFGKKVELPEREGWKLGIPDPKKSYLATIRPKDEPGKHFTGPGEHLPARSPVTRYVNAVGDGAGRVLDYVSRRFRSESPGGSGRPDAGTDKPVEKENKPNAGGFGGAGRLLQDGSEVKPKSEPTGGDWQGDGSSTAGSGGKTGPVEGHTLSGAKQDPATTTPTFGQKLTNDLNARRDHLGQSRSTEHDAAASHNQDARPARPSGVAPREAAPREPAPAEPAEPGSGPGATRVVGNGGVAGRAGRDGRSAQGSATVTQTVLPKRTTGETWDDPPWSVREELASPRGESTPTFATPVRRAPAERTPTSVDEITDMRAKARDAAAGRAGEASASRDLEAARERVEAATQRVGEAAERRDTAAREHDEALARRAAASDLRTRVTAVGDVAVTKGRVAAAAEAVNARVKDAEAAAEGVRAAAEGTRPPGVTPGTRVTETAAQQRAEAAARDAERAARRAEVIGERAGWLARKQAEVARRQANVPGPASGAETNAMSKAAVNAKDAATAKAAALAKAATAKAAALAKAAAAARAATTDEAARIAAEAADAVGATRLAAAARAAAPAVNRAYRASMHFDAIRQRAGLTSIDPAGTSTAARAGRAETPEQPRPDPATMQPPRPAHDATRGTDATQAVVRANRGAPRDERAARRAAAAEERIANTNANPTVARIVAGPDVHPGLGELTEVERRILDGELAGHGLSPAERVWVVRRFRVGLAQAREGLATLRAERRVRPDGELSEEELQERQAREFALKLDYVQFRWGTAPVPSRLSVPVRVPGAAGGREGVVPESLQAELTPGQQRILDGFGEGAQIRHGQRVGALPWVWRVNVVRNYQRWLPDAQQQLAQALADVQERADSQLSSDEVAERRLRIDALEATVRRYLGGPVSEPAVLWGPLTEVEARIMDGELAGGGLPEVVRAPVVRWFREGAGQELTEVERRIMNGELAGHGLLPERRVEVVRWLRAEIGRVEGRLAALREELGDQQMSQAELELSWELTRLRMGTARVPASSPATRPVRALLVPERLTEAEQEILAGRGYGRGQPLHRRVNIVRNYRAWEAQRVQAEEAAARRLEAVSAGHGDDFGVKSLGAGRFLLYQGEAPMASAADLELVRLAEGREVLIVDPSLTDFDAIRRYAERRVVDRPGQAPDPLLVQLPGTGRPLTGTEFAQLATLLLGDGPDDGSALRMVARRLPERPETGGQLVAMDAADRRTFAPLAHYYDAYPGQAPRGTPYDLVETDEAGRFEVPGMSGEGTQAWVAESVAVTGSGTDGKRVLSLRPAGQDQPVPAGGSPVRVGAADVDVPRQVRNLVQEILHDLRPSQRPAVDWLGPQVRKTFAGRLLYQGKNPRGTWKALLKIRRPPKWDALIVDASITSEDLIRTYAARADAKRRPGKDGLVVILPGTWPKLSPAGFKKLAADLLRDVRGRAVVRLSAKRLTVRPPSDPQLTAVDDAGRPTFAGWAHSYYAHKSPRPAPARPHGFTPARQAGQQPADTAEWVVDDIEVPDEKTGETDLVPWVRPAGLDTTRWRPAPGAAAAGRAGLILVGAPGVVVPTEIRRKVNRAVRGRPASARPMAIWYGLPDDSTERADQRAWDELHGAGTAWPDLGHALHSTPATVLLYKLSGPDAAPPKEYLTKLAGVPDRPGALRIAPDPESLHPGYLQQVVGKLTTQARQQAFIDLRLAPPSFTARKATELQAAVSLPVEFGADQLGGSLPANAVGINDQGEPAPTNVDMLFAALGPSAVDYTQAITAYRITSAAPAPQHEQGQPNQPPDQDTHAMGEGHLAWKRPAAVLVGPQTALPDLLTKLASWPVKPHTTGLLLGAPGEPVPQTVWDAIRKLPQRLPAAFLERLHIDERTSELPRAQQPPAPSPSASQPAPAQAEKTPKQRLAEFHAAADEVGRQLPAAPTAENLAECALELYKKLKKIESDGTAVRMPTPDFKVGQVEKNLIGGFRYPTWLLWVSDKVGDKLATWRTIVKTMRHEWVHFRDYSLIVRYLAVEVMRQFKAVNDDSREALRALFPTQNPKVLTFALNNPLDPQSVEYDKAKRMHEVAFGAAGKRFEAEEKRLSTLFEELSKATDQHTKLVNQTPRPPLAERFNANVTMFERKVAYAAALARYAKHLREVEAFDVEQQLDDLWRASTPTTSTPTTSTPPPTLVAHAFRVYTGHHPPDDARHVATVVTHAFPAGDAGSACGNQQSERCGSG